MAKSDLGKCLKLNRESCGLTLRQVEEATEVSNAYLSQLENGKISRPSANVLYKLATLYGCRIEDFLLAAGIIQEQQYEREKGYSIESLTKSEQEQLLEYLAFLKRKK